MRNTFTLLAGYNSWANKRLYDAAKTMSPEGYRAERGAFFGSIHRTFNHLLVADRIWLKRFGVRADAPAALDVILFDDLADLRQAREAEDAAMETWVASLSDADLVASFTYSTIVRPQAVTQPIWSALSHVFNHQTHHRGQVHALMTTIEHRDFAPSLDLLIYQRETGIGLG